jgi:hypothetical protein
MNDSPLPCASKYEHQSVAFYFWKYFSTLFPYIIVYWREFIFKIDFNFRRIPFWIETIQISTRSAIHRFYMIFIIEDCTYGGERNLSRILKSFRLRCFIICTDAAAAAACNCDVVYHPVLFVYMTKGLKPYRRSPGGDSWPFSHINVQYGTTMKGDPLYIWTFQKSQMHKPRLSSSPNTFNTYIGYRVLRACAFLFIFPFFFFLSRSRFNALAGLYSTCSVVINLLKNKNGFSLS